METEFLTGETIWTREVKFSRFKALEISKLLTMSYWLIFTEVPRDAHSVLSKLYTALTKGPSILHSLLWFITPPSNACGRSLPGSFMVYWTRLLPQEASLASLSQTPHPLPDFPIIFLSWLLSLSIITSLANHSDSTSTSRICESTYLSNEV